MAFNGIPIFFYSMLNAVENTGVELFLALSVPMIILSCTWHGKALRGGTG